jgi:hypothetical protein
MNAISGPSAGVTIAARIVIACTMIIGMAPARLGAQEASATSIDLAAIVLTPWDEGLDGYLHAGAFDESLVDEARIAAAYRGSPDEEDVFAGLLESAGFVRKHLASLHRLSAAETPQVESIVRSYVTSFHSPAGAQTAFVALEDETGAISAEDLQPSRQFGEQADLTMDGGFDAESRPFRSLDLAFRVGNLIGGVTLIGYPGASGFEPDQGELEALAAILEARLIDPPEPSIGASVARLEPAATVTYDDAYYRLNGVDLPLFNESEASGDLRREAYGDAHTVYQLFQGIDGTGNLGGLYSVTLYAFADDQAAAAWMAESERLLKINDYYENIEPADPGSITSDEALAYTFGPFGTPPRARITLARMGTAIVRIQIVPNGTITELAAGVSKDLTNIQLACIEQGNCISIPVPEALAQLMRPPEASPEASPQAAG